LAPDECFESDAPPASSARPAPKFAVGDKVADRGGNVKTVKALDWCDYPWPKPEWKYQTDDGSWRREHTLVLAPPEPERPKPKYQQWQLAQGHENVGQIVGMKFVPTVSPLGCQPQWWYLIEGGWWEPECHVQPADPRQWCVDESRALPGEKVRVIEHPLDPDGVPLALDELTESSLPDAKLAGKTVQVERAFQAGLHAHYTIDNKGYANALDTWNCRRVEKGKP
jgi:hypothetical protein